MSVRVRIAPSPTGLLHIGTARTALMNYLFAKQNKGSFILRIEDTDKERSQAHYEEDIISGLHKLGIHWDEGPDIGGDYGPYRQSERKDIYRPYLEELLKNGHAYTCFCSQEALDEERKKAEKEKKPFRYSKKCKGLSDEMTEKLCKDGVKSVIRLKVPEDEEFTFTDLVRGENTQNLGHVTGDMVIAKDLDTPLYNFVVVVDDHLMEISHVIRGEDHITNTFKQILVYEAFGWDIPQFGHLPLILNPDKSKLSKRKTAASVDEYLLKGYLPEALVNFIALLGWNDGTEKEIYSMDELIKAFSMDRVGKSGGVWDIQRLQWMNKEYIKKLSDEELAAKVFPLLEKEEIISHVINTKDEFRFKVNEIGEEYGVEDLASWVHHEKERIETINEMVGHLDFYFVQVLDYQAELLIGKKMTKASVLFALEGLLPVLEKEKDFSEEKLREIVIAKIEEWGVGNGEVLWPLRAALTGKDKSPGAFEVAGTLGKDKTLQRIEVAIEKLKK